MIKIKNIQQDTLEISQLISANSRRDTVVELSLPKTLDFNEKLSSSEFFENNISKRKSLYQSKSPSLTLLYTKYLGQKEIETKQLTTSLSLFSHQYIQRLKDHINVLSKDKSNELEGKTKELVLEDKIKELVLEVEKILESFRSLDLIDDQAVKAFEKIDFVISFETEQFFLKMVSFLQDVEDTSIFRKELIILAEKEMLHRMKRHYHSNDGDFHLVKENDDKFVRILNRIEMRKRFIELPLKISEKVYSAGKREKYISVGISTGTIMTVVGFILLQARLVGLDSTLMFVFGIAGLYIFRDLFKEEFKQFIYNKIISKRPKTKSFIFVPNNDDSVGMTHTWFFKEDKTQLNQSKYKDQVSIILKEDIKLTDFDHYGFKKMRTFIDINLKPIMSMIEKENRKLLIYGENEDKDTSEVVNLPRQYKINLKITEKLFKRKNYFLGHEDVIEKEKKYTIILNREKIISIEEKL